MKQNKPKPRPKPRRRRPNPTAIAPPAPPAPLDPAEEFAIAFAWRLLDRFLPPPPGQPPPRAATWPKQTEPREREDITELKKNPDGTYG